MVRTRAFYTTRAAAFAVLGGGAVATGLATRLPRRTAFAEAPSTDDIPSKKPIYSTYPVSVQDPTLPPSVESKLPTTDETKKSKPSKQSTTTSKDSLTTSPTPTDRLTKQVKKVRLAIHSLSQRTENTVNDVFTWAFRTETNVANTIASLAPKPETGEQLLPGAIYVLVTTLAGSIISRNRGILLRAATPLGFGLVAGWSLIPVTMQNTADLLWVYEKKVPMVSETHAFVGGFAREAWSQIRDRSKAVTEWADETAGESRRKVEGWVEKGR